MRLTSAIAAKSIGGYSDTDLKVLRDSVPFTSEAAQGGTFEFFRNSKNNEPDSNFIENPLPEVKQHDLLAMGLVLSPGILTGDNGFSLVRAYAALTDGNLELSTSQRETLLEADVQQHIVTEDHGWSVKKNDTPGFTEILEASGQDVLRLEEPPLIEPREIFEIDYHSARSGGIPAAADYTDVTVTPKLQLFIQVAAA